MGWGGMEGGHECDPLLGRLRKQAATYSHQMSSFGGFEGKHCRRGWGGREVEWWPGWRGE